MQGLAVGLVGIVTSVLVVQRWLKASGLRVRKRSILGDLHDVEDVCDEAAAAGVVSDRLITGRQRAWYAEGALAAARDQGTAPDPQLHRALDSAKAMVAGALDEWRGFGLPLPAGAGPELMTAMNCLPPTE